LLLQIKHVNAKHIFPGANKTLYYHSSRHVQILLPYYLFSLKKKDILLRNMTPPILVALYNQSPWWNYSFNIPESKAEILSSRWHKGTSLKKIIIITINIIDMRTSKFIWSFSSVYLGFEHFFLILLTGLLTTVMLQELQFTNFTAFVTVECNFLKSIKGILQNIYGRKLIKWLLWNPILWEGTKNSCKIFIQSFYLIRTWKLSDFSFILQYILKTSNCCIL
jgi:hypothetical protein